MQKLSLKDLIQASKERKSDSKSLLEAGRWHSSIYVGGYAVEIGLKACIAKRMNKEIFFDPKNASKIYTHNLKELVDVAALTESLSDKLAKDIVFSNNWKTIHTTWKESLRYETTRTRKEALDFYKALTQRKHGVLTWIRSEWS